MRKNGGYRKLSSCVFALVTTRRDLPSSTGCLLQFLNANVFELHLHRVPDMELKGHDTFLRGLGFLLIDHIYCLHSVDEMLKMIPFGDDHVIVPVPLLNVCLNGFR